MSASRLRSWLALTVWLGVLMLAVGWLHQLGRALPAPSIEEPSVWLERLGPETAVVAVLRLLALAGGSYLLVVTALAMLVHALHLPAAVVRLADAGVPAVVRRLTRAALGVTLAVGMTAAPASARNHPTAGPATSVPAAERDDAVVMRRLPDADVARPPGADDPPTAAAPGPSGRTAMPVGMDDGGTHLVRAGDHFWSIAEAVLVDRWNRPVSDSEIDPYWRLLVAGNRSLTPDPDLLLPGQLVSLPPPPPAP